MVGSCPSNIRLVPYTDTITDLIFPVIKWPDLLYKHWLWLHYHLRFTFNLHFHFPDQADRCIIKWNPKRGCNTKPLGGDRRPRHLYHSLSYTWTPRETWLSELSGCTKVNQTLYKGSGRLILGGVKKIWLATWKKVTTPPSHAWENATLLSA